MELKQIILEIIKEILNEDSTNLNSNFKHWFGSSKVVNKNKTPKIVVHGTNAKFEVFDKSKQEFGMHGKGFYFADKKFAADELYGNGKGTGLKVYLKIETPFYMYDEFTVQEIKDIFKTDYNKVLQIIKDEQEIGNTKIGGYLFYSLAGNDKLIKAGYDGIIHGDIYVEPNQIKSVNNDGTWDINDNNIYS